jgi:hypothetical protein
MSKSIVKGTLAFLMLSLAVVCALPVSAQDVGLNYVGVTGLQTSNLEPQAFAASVVKYLMTFLGIISVIVILLGGFRWMTAAGNEDKVAEAKKILASGVVGLIVILAAFAVVTFVIDISGKALSGNI